MLGFFFARCGETAPNPLVSPTRSANRNHGVSLSGTADDLFHNAVGSGGRRRPVPGAQRTKPGVGRVGCRCRHRRRPCLSWRFLIRMFDRWDHQRCHFNSVCLAFVWLARSQWRFWCCCYCCLSCDGGPASPVFHHYPPLHHHHIPASTSFANKGLMISDFTSVVRKCHPPPPPPVPLHSLTSVLKFWCLPFCDVTKGMSLNSDHVVEATPLLANHLLKKNCPPHLDLSKALRFKRLLWTQG